MGRHMVTHGKVEMQHNHCCVTNVPRGFINAAECYVLKTAEGLVVNHYSDFTAKAENATVQISGSYLRDGKVQITIEATNTMELQLRIPDFSSYTTLNGKEIIGENGYYTLRLNAGTTELSLTFEMTVQLRQLEEAPKHFPTEDFRVRRYIIDNPVREEDMTWDRRATVVYGPLLLTRSKLVGNTEEEMFASDTVAHRGFSCCVEPMENENVTCAFRVTFTDGKEKVVTNMCDYGSGTNLESPEDDRLFNIFV
jgi:hypothetical protein